MHSSHTCDLMAGKGGNPLNHNATSSEEFLFDPMNDAAFKSLIRAEETRDVVTGVLSDLTPIPIFDTFRKKEFYKRR